MSGYTTALDAVADDMPRRRFSRRHLAFVALGALVALYGLSVDPFLTVVAGWLVLAAATRRTR